MEVSKPLHDLKYKLIYICFWDISKDIPQSINEREFIQELLSNVQYNSLYVGPCFNHPYNVNLPSEKVIAEKKLEKTVLSQIKFQLWLFVRLCQLIRSEKRHVIICVRPHYFALAPLCVTRIFQIPYIIKWAGLPITEILRQRKDSSILKWIGIFCHVMNIKFADRLWVVTDKIGNYLMKTLKVNPDKIFVLPNGVNIKRFHINPSRGLSANIKARIPVAGHYIVFAGSLGWYSGVEFLILAAEKLIAQNYDYVFLIAGSGDCHSELIKMAKAKGLQDRFIFLGFLPYRTLPGLYELADVLVAVFQTIYIEKCGSSALKIFQYLASGKPVVAVKTDDHRFIEDNNLGRVIVSEDTDALADAIVGLIESEDKSSAIKRIYRFQYIAEHFSYPVIVKKFMEYSNSLWELSE